MENATILTITGVAATVILGSWGVFLAIKQRRYPARIMFVAERFIRLFADVVKDLPELSVLYKGKAIEPNAVLIGGTLLNRGNKDIAPSMIEKPVEASLPQGAKCLTAKVVATSPNVKANIAIEDDRILVFDIPTMLRCEEYIRFTALAELPSKDDPWPDPVFRFTHRIADTRPVRSKSSPPPKDFPQDIRFFAGLSAFIALVALFGGILSPSERLTPELHYSVKTGTGRTIEAEVDVQRDGAVTVQGIDDLSYRETMTLADLISKREARLVMGQKLSHPRRGLLGWGCWMLAISLLCLLSGHLWHRRNRKLRRILGLE
jgi:hypothetical protein